jgi:Mn2+/Fe2+ NRAMP family transporter
VRRVFYGAFAACLLPLLYAVLGTCAYLLRQFEQQTSAKTFIPSRANSARFLIAAIAGAVVGPFNFTISQGASISPLAIGFLAGYAIDVFFSFLEALTKSNAASPSAASPARG